jgi:hypothetical protein
MTIVVQIPADDVLGVKGKGCGGLKRVFRVVHWKTERLLRFPGSHGRDLNEPQQILKEGPGIGPYKVCDIRQ